MKFNKVTAYILFGALFGAAGLLQLAWPNNPLSEFLSQTKAHLEQQINDDAPVAVQP